MRTNKSALFGTMITAGTAIGAGMFSLPTVSSGMWLGYSLICLMLIWLLNYLSSMYVLEANLHFEPGASFDTITSKILGKRWNILVSLSIGFLMYVLLYAYFSAFGNIVIENLDWEYLKGKQWTQGLASIILGGALAIAIWVSTAVVGRLSSILLFGMILSFLISMTGLAFQIEIPKLLDSHTKDTSYFPYLWAALPYFITSFGFVTVVPSLYKYYGKKPDVIKKSLLWGSLLILLVYALFIIISFGNISRFEFIEINKKGGNIGYLVNAFQKGENKSFINYALNLFSNLAIITSFLGIGLSLFDFIADKFSLKNNKLGRLKTTLITFIPPGLASFFYPNGFIAAIGFAGLFCIFGFFIAPYFMIRKVRENKTSHHFKVWGGNKLLIVFILASIVVAACHILAMFNYLPQW